MKAQSQMKANLKFFGYILFLLMSEISLAAVNDVGEYTFFKTKTFIKDPLLLRDPFKRKTSGKSKSGKSRIQDKVDGVYVDEKVSIENSPLENIKISGIVIGDERRAIVKLIGDNSGDVHYVKEGMKLGPSGAEVRAILPGGIVLVEKIKNVYDQEEYLETIIPVSSD